MIFNSEEFNNIDDIKEKYNYINSSTKIKWNEIDINKNMSEEFIDNWFNEFNLIRITKYKYLSEEFMTKHKEKLGWKFIIMTQKLNDDFILSNMDVITDKMINIMVVRRYLSVEVLTFHIERLISSNNDDEINWGDIVEHQKLSEEFIIKYSKYLGWKKISRYQKLSEEFIKENINKLDFFNLYKYQKLNDEFVLKNVKKFDLSELFKYQILKEETIEKIIKLTNLDEEKGFFNKAAFEKLYKYQTLSEEFIMKYINFSLESFEEIFINQKVSEKFIIKINNKFENLFYDEINWANISKYQELSEGFIKKYKKSLSIKILVENQKLSDEFADMYIDKINEYEG